MPIKFRRRRCAAIIGAHPCRHGFAGVLQVLSHEHAAVESGEKTLGHHEREGLTEAVENARLLLLGKELQDTIDRLNGATCVQRT